MNEKVHIAMAADAPYMKGLEIAKESMIASCSDPSRLVFHLFGESEALGRRIRNEFGTYKGSPMAYVRLYLSELLPEIDWVIYSDVDTLWRRDVLELASLFDETKSIQWVKDLPGTTFEFVNWCRNHDVPIRHDVSRTYACSGICIINLRRWRERNIFNQFKMCVKRYGCPRAADQDILNITLADEAGLLPKWWDVLIPSPENTPRCVLHMTGVGRCFAHPYTGRIVEYRYWEHVARGTPFRLPLALPFYLRDWMIRLCLPFAGVVLRERIRRRFAWRWFFRKYSSILGLRSPPQAPCPPTGPCRSTCTRQGALPR